MTYCIFILLFLGAATYVAFWGNCDWQISRRAMDWTCWNYTKGFVNCLMLHIIKKNHLETSSSHYFLLSFFAFLPVVSSGYWLCDLFDVKNKRFHCSFTKYIQFNTAEKPPHPRAKTFHRKIWDFFPLSKFIFIIWICPILWLMETKLMQANLSILSYLVPFYGSHDGCTWLNKSVKYWEVQPWWDLKGNH